jgi:hypothetical protein
MDEGTRGLKSQSPAATPETLGNEISVVRGELDVLLAELDRRRHETLDVHLQLRRHGFGVVLTTVAFLGTAAGVVWLSLWRQRRRDRLAAQAGRLRQAVSRMVEQPERVAAEPTILGKIAAAAGSAAAASLVRKLLERGVESFLEHQRAAIEPSRLDVEHPADERIQKTA